ncbi:extracellular solute-binding protein [Pseudoroseomonas wenyumeiae]|uniref:Carbohydrate ABC transporter substrate-binding protein n=1 Tax=Teichococcus wenyumeiae TaxID=2478470 RepID=A0A3A9JWM5_9PROT|nr:ABC transporter substrate-binding protein [Pseudoroseomonas wenyumeiae]RKK03449.1 carbohydrate ABC transporter substrate-binding protein [Pseudoroseomonas wenyumeiae]RMI27094.1 extracellular solute-binding protein [Pseudoroseomonas wenyumeiae]
MKKAAPFRRSFAAALAGLLLGAAAWAPAARAEELVFLSTQLRPIESAQKMRTQILAGAPVPTNFVTEQPPQLGVHVRAEAQAGKPVSSLIGGLHGELLPLAGTRNLAPLDDVLGSLTNRQINPAMLEAGKLGGSQQLYIPWMQATYIMVANKQALPFLPAGADINALTYEQLAQWAGNIQEKTGKRLLGFPAGPTGLMPRFFEGYLYPSFTGGVVRSFRSPDAERMWTQFRDLWKFVNPNSTNYGFMQEPLLSGDVWIAFDHVARLMDALSRKPDDFVAFPAPAGPKGRGWMPVVAGLSIANGAPAAAEAAKLIEYLTRPAVQIETLKAVAFFPVVQVEMSVDLDPGLRLAADAVAKMGAAPDSLVSALPIGLDQRGGEFDKLFMDTFQRVVLRGEPPRAVLDRQGEAMKRIIADTKAACWAPDARSDGPCPVE